MSILETELPGSADAVEVRCEKKGKTMGVGMLFAEMEKEGV